MQSVVPEDPYAMLMWELYLWPKEIDEGYYTAHILGIAEGIAKSQKTKSKRPRLVTPTVEKGANESN